MNPRSVAKVIDHTLLSPKADEEALRELVEQYREHRFASLCVYPADLVYLPDDVTATTVLGFPHGKELGTTLAAAAEAASGHGADEIDVVMDRSLVRSGRAGTAGERLEEACAVFDGTVKVIVEACDLDEDQLRAAVEACVDAGADFVKTSTGMGAHGAREQDLRVIADELERLGADLGIKASGGIGSAAEADSMRRAAGRGWDPDRFRIGASSGAAIVEEVMHDE